jgi:EamA domain-containing membrane protein RarD
MSNNNVLKGVFLVAFGATSYGMLATKWPIMKDIPPQITTSQFVLGIIGILLINLFKNKKKNTALQASKQNIFQLMLAGTSLD